MATLGIVPTRAGESAPRVHDGVSAPAKAWSQAMEAGDIAALARMHDDATISFPPATIAQLPS